MKMNLKTNDMQVIKYCYTLYTSVVSMFFYGKSHVLCIQASKNEAAITLESALESHTKTLFRFSNYSSCNMKMKK